MTPSAQRFAGAGAFSILATILAYYMSFPPPDVNSLPWLLLMGLVVGYVVWPTLHAAWRRHGLGHATPARILKAFVGAGLATVLVAYVQYIVLDDGLNVEGWIVAFVFIASLAYFNLGTTPRPRG